MPNAYADTSALFALFHPRDEFFNPVNQRQRKSAVRFLYPPWLRYELRHNLRRTRTDADGEAAWRALQAAEAHALHGLTLDLLGQLQQADKLSEAHGRKLDLIGAGDVLHVAGAIQLAADEFWTCDGVQADWARAAGLKVVEFKPDAD